MLNPKKILEFYDKYFKALVLLTGMIFLLAIFFVLQAPDDYQQGAYSKIMYVHVPAAWLSLGIYSIMGICSFIYLVWQIPLSDLIAKSAATTGTLFAAITLVTGSLWGKPIWGSWWVWDARLTSMLILFFFYVSYLVLASITKSIPNNKACAALAVLGCINIPIVKFSVNIWNSLHQPASILKLSGPAIHSSMLIPLLLMFLLYSMFFALNLLLSCKYRIFSAKIKRHIFLK